MNNTPLSIVMLGATGAVGTQVVQHLLTFSELQRLTLLGRRPVEDRPETIVQQQKIDIFALQSYERYLPGHQAAICSLGVGQPSKMSREEFTRIDKGAVLDFATACKQAGVRHFELLASVGINSKSASFYLRTKGELVEAIKSLRFERFTIFEPSMILTPVNRYGLSQAITLAVWPKLQSLLLGGLRKYRGIPVELLGKAIAKNVITKGSGVEILYWDDFMNLCNSRNSSDV
jgi:putative NADH-flavin reductase